MCVSITYIVAVATTDITVDTVSGEICLSSSLQSCGLTKLTQYNVSILDLAGSELFSGQNIPESTCVAINEVVMPEHAPFVIISVQPFNQYIEYSSVTQPITSGALYDFVVSI